MNIERVLAGIIQTFGRTFGVGHTHTLLRAVKDSDAPNTHIVFGDRRAGFVLEQGYPAMIVTALSDFESCGVFNGERKPILFDNYAIISLAHACLAKIEEYKRKIAKQDLQIESLERQADTFYTRCCNAESAVALLKEKIKQYEEQK